MADHPRDERAFLNNLPDSSERPLLETDTSHSSQLHPQVGLQKDVRQEYEQQAVELMQSVLSAYEKGFADKQDVSVYTGNSGVAILLLKAHKLTGNMTYLQKALDLLRFGLSALHGRYRDCTFLCGDAGPLALTAVICNKLGQDYNQLRDESIQRIVNLADDVCKSKSLPNEFLYGRAGYLYTLLFLQEELGEQFIKSELVLQVANSAVNAGIQMSEQMGVICPLMYSWYNELYTGAAHGHAGILYILLKVAIKYSSQVKYDNVVRATVDYMMTLKFPSGNYPSSFESKERDRLVHWCHGAPGFIYMFAAAYQRYGDLKYKKAALECAEVIWQRGLLKKGYGICHGVAGNAYAFLCAFKLSGEEKYLNYACQFANWCCDYGKHGCRTPDRPYSLFEGMAGTAYFLFDLIQPYEARFPAFEC